MTRSSLVVALALAFSIRTPAQAPFDSAQGRPFDSAQGRPFDSAQGKPAAADARYEQLATRVTQAMEEHRVPGVAMGVVYEGRTTARGFGIASVEDPRPISSATVFPIASISKTFAATAVMRLAEQHRVDLRAPVRQYLPDFKVDDEAVSRDVSIWHLLTHTSGWEGQIAAADRGDETLARFVDGNMRTNMQLAPPGAAWSYNNAGFSVAGRVIEVITGKSIGAALSDLVFKPLRLARTVTSPREMMTYPFALGHSGAGDGSPSIVRPFAYSTSVTAGGISTSLDDLLAYARFHLGAADATNGDGPVLPRAALESMRTPQLQKQATDDEMGIGWHLRTVGGVRTAAHGGTLNGHVLLLELVPEHRFAIAILTNTSTGWRLVQDVERAALKAYLGVDFRPNQAIAHRGLVETLPRVQPLAVQPTFADYVGRYVRPMTTVIVREEGGRLIVRQEPRGAATGGTASSMPITFYGPDRAVVTEGSDEGQSVEFVRGPGGAVQWVRVVGRIALRSR